MIIARISTITNTKSVSNQNKRRDNDEKTLIFGVATLGGYLVKRHLDKRIADSDYLYSGYVDVALGDGARFLANGAIKGCNKFLRAKKRQGKVRL